MLGEALNEFEPFTQVGSIVKIKLKRLQRLFDFARCKRVTPKVRELVRQSDNLGLKGLDMLPYEHSARVFDIVDILLRNLARLLLQFGQVSNQPRFEIGKSLRNVGRQRTRFAHTRVGQEQC